MAEQACFSFQNQASCQEYKGPDNKRELCLWSCPRNGQLSDCRCIDKDLNEDPVVLVFGAVGTMLLLLIIFLFMHYCIRRRQKREEDEKKALAEEAAKRVSGASGKSAEEKKRWYKEQAANNRNAGKPGMKGKNNNKSGENEEDHEENDQPSNIAIAVGHGGSSKVRPLPFRRYNSYYDAKPNPYPSLDRNFIDSLKRKEKEEEEEARSRHQQAVEEEKNKANNNSNNTSTNLNHRESFGRPNTSSSNNNLSSGLVIQNWDYDKDMEGGGIYSQNGGYVPPAIIPISSSQQHSRTRSSNSRTFTPKSSTANTPQQLIVGLGGGASVPNSNKNQQQQENVSRAPRNVSESGNTNNDKPGDGYFPPLHSLAPAPAPVPGIGKKSPTPPGRNSSTPRSSTTMSQLNGTQSLISPVSDVSSSSHTTSASNYNSTMLKRNNSSGSHNSSLTSPPVGASTLLNNSSGVSSHQHLLTRNNSSRGGSGGGVNNSFEFTLTGPTPRGSMIQLQPTTNTSSSQNHTPMRPPPLNLQSFTNLVLTDHEEDNAENKNNKKKDNATAPTASQRIVIPQLEDIPTPNETGQGGPHPVSVVPIEKPSPNTYTKNPMRGISSHALLQAMKNSREQSQQQSQQQQQVGGHSAPLPRKFASFNPSSNRKNDQSQQEEQGEIRWVSPASGSSPRESNRGIELSDHRPTLSKLLEANKKYHQPSPPSAAARKNAAAMNHYLNTISLSSSSAKNSFGTASSSSSRASTPPGLSPLSALHNRVKRDVHRTEKEKLEQEHAKRQLMLGSNTKPSAVAVGNNTNNGSSSDETTNISPPSSSSPAITPTKSQQRQKNLRSRSSTFPQPLPSTNPKPYHAPIPYHLL